MRKDYTKEFVNIDSAETSIATLLKQAQYNISKTMYTDALLIYAYNCNPIDYNIIELVARIAKQRRTNEVSLPGAPHELLNPQLLYQDPRANYRRLVPAARVQILNRLERAGFTQTDFMNMADSITPEEFPDKLHISESTMKNFTKVISDPRDRNEAYYDMKNNPQKDFCEEFWDVLQKLL